MRQVAVAMVLAFSGVVAAGAEPGANITPIFHQLVAFTLPANFTSAVEKTNGSFYMRQYVPTGESLQQVTRMVTVTGTRDLATNPNVTPAQMIERMTAGFRRNCPDTYSTAQLGLKKIDGYDALQVVASCGHLQSGAAAYSETAVILAVKGSNDYYAFQWMERGADSKQPPALDTAYWTRQFAQLQPIRLCPLVPGDASSSGGCAGR
jgi:hypothetical protein